MEFEKAKEILENEVANICDEELSEALEVVLKNSIPKKKIKDSIKLFTSRDDFDYVGTEWSESEVVDYLKELLEEDK